MSKTKKYIVVMSNCCLKGIVAEEIGAKVSLTDEKAASMAGKVRLLKDHEGSSKSEQELIKENAKLIKQVGELTAQVEDLTAQLDEATKPDKKDK